MTIGEIKMNARQFEQLGEDPPGVRLELVHGEIRVSPSPSFEHSFTDTELRILIGQHIKTLGLGQLVGDVDTRIDEWNVRRPDIIFIAKSRLGLRDKTKHGIRFPPDLCIEIISPGSVTFDEKDKFELYAQFGVAHYWIVDPLNRTFKAFQLDAGTYKQGVFGSGQDVVSAEPFPSLKIPLAAIWPPED